MNCSRRDTRRDTIDTAGAKLRIASYPDRNPGNPYIELFYRAVAEYSIEHAGRLVPDRAWFDDAGSTVDVVHIHWPERIWRGRKRGRLDRIAALITARSARGVYRLRRFLDAAGKRRVMRVWTVHNMAHHEGVSAIDRWGYRELARHSDLLLCFSASAASELRREYGQDVPILVIPHGSYTGAYPPPRARRDACAQFGLRDDVPVVSCLGLLRPYKGVELACEAVESLGGDVQLLVGGQPHRDFDTAGLVARAESSGGTVVALPRVLTDTEFSDAVGASDAVLLPYRAVTGSGVLFAAWTLGAGVIASDLPFFREMLDDRPLLGRTFRAGASADLARAIQEYLAISRDDRSHAISEMVETFSMNRVVRPFVEALWSWRGRCAHRDSGVGEGN